MKDLCNNTVYIMMLLEKEAKNIIEIANELNIYSFELKDVLDEMVSKNLIKKDKKYKLTFEGYEIVQQIKPFY